MDLLKTALAATAALAVAGPALAAPQVTAAWSRPAAAGTTGAGFFTLANPGKAPDALVAAESPAARSVEIHRSSMAGGVMKMERQPRVPVPPGGKVLFAPGGYHLMFMALKAAQKTGGRLPVTLVFESGARVKTELEVRVTAPSAQPAGHTGH